MLGNIAAENGENRIGRSTKISIIETACRESSVGR